MSGPGLVVLLPSGISGQKGPVDRPPSLEEEKLLPLLKHTTLIGKISLSIVP